MLPKEIQGIRFTPIETQILNMLVSGEARKVKELLVWDDYADEGSLRVHLHSIKAKLVNSSYRIYSGRENNVLVYRLVSLLPGVQTVA